METVITRSVPPEVKANGKGQSPHGSRQRNAEQIERDVMAYSLHLRGCSYRAIQAELGAKGIQTAVRSVERGREYVRKHGVDVESVRDKITAIFDQVLTAGAQQLMEQRATGVVTEMIDAEGNRMLKTVRGMDTRLMGEMSRGLQRWAEFCGLMDRAPEQHTQATTVVLTAPAAGAEFQAKYEGMGSAQALEPSAGQQVVDTKSTVVSDGGPGWGEPPAAAA